MYESNKFLSSPRQNTKIWRYMDFTKYVSLLELNSLFFSRADKLVDPFEGTYPEYVIKLKQKELGSEQYSSWSRTLRKVPKFTLVNSWSIDNIDNPALWKLYVQSKNGISIQSTFRRLKNSFNSFEWPVNIGKVIYIDYYKDKFPTNDTILAFVHKRKNFQYENELRAIVEYFEKIDENTKEPRFKGAYIPVDINELIENIYISPTADDWFYDLVELVTKKYGLDKQLIASDLVDKPQW